MRALSALLLCSTVICTVHAETQIVTLGPTGYSDSDVIAAAGDHVIIEASAAHPLKFEMNPDITCTSAQCGYLFPYPNGPFHFYCADHPNSEAGSITVSENSDVIHSDGFDVLLIPVDV